MLHQKNLLVKQVIHKREVALAGMFFSSIHVIALIVKFKVQEPIDAASDSSQVKTYLYDTIVFPIRHPFIPKDYS